MDKQRTNQVLFNRVNGLGLKAFTYQQMMPNKNATSAQSTAYMSGTASANFLLNGRNGNQAAVNAYNNQVVSAKGMNL